MKRSTRSSTLTVASETGVVFSPGAGIDYSFNPRTAFRAQLDIPIGEGGNTTRFWIGISRRMGQ